MPSLGNEGQAQPTKKRRKVGDKIKYQKGREKGERDIRELVDRICKEQRENSEESLLLEGCNQYRLELKTFSILKEQIIWEKKKRKVKIVCQQLPKKVLYTSMAYNECCLTVTETYLSDHACTQYVIIPQDRPSKSPL